MTAINEQKGILGKNAEVTIEVEMRGPKGPIETMEKIKNYKEMLSENPDFYPVINTGVTEVMTKLAETGAWGSLSSDHRDIVNELTQIVKKCETEY